MNSHAAFISVAAALITALFLSATWSALAAEPGTTTLTTGSPFAQSSPSHYQSLTERLQKQWRVDPLVAEAHNLSSTGWGTAACAPRGSGLTQTPAVGAGSSTEQCLQQCTKRTSLGVPNGILLCRSSCL